jgi:hypothetical protein
MLIISITLASPISELMEETKRIEIKLIRKKILSHYILIKDKYPEEYKALKLQSQRFAEAMVFLRENPYSADYD